MKVTPLQRRVKSRIREIRDAFETFDIKGVGSIDHLDIKRVLSEMGLSDVNEEECRDIISAADVDGNQALEIHEFVRAVVDDSCVLASAESPYQEDPTTLLAEEEASLETLCKVLTVEPGLRMKSEMDHVHNYLLEKKPVVEYLTHEKSNVMEQLTRFATVKHYEDGDFIFHQNDPTTEFCVVLRGAVKVLSSIFISYTLNLGYLVLAMLTFANPNSRSL